MKPTQSFGRGKFAVYSQLLKRLIAEIYGLREALFAGEVTAQRQPRYIPWVPTGCADFEIQLNGGGFFLF